MKTTSQTPEPSNQRRGAYFIERDHRLALVEDRDRATAGAPRRCPMIPAGYGTNPRGVGGVMRVKVDWLVDTGRRQQDPAANLELGGEIIGRVYHDGLSWSFVVRGERRGGYANINQLTRDARRVWERG